MLLSALNLKEGEVARLYFLKKTISSGPAYVVLHGIIRHNSTLHLNQSPYSIPPFFFGTYEPCTYGLSLLPNWLGGSQDHWKKWQVVEVGGGNRSRGL